MKRISIVPLFIVLSLSMGVCVALLPWRWHRRRQDDDAPPKVAEDGEGLGARDEVMPLNNAASTDGDDAWPLDWGSTDDVNLMLAEYAEEDAQLNQLPEITISEVQKNLDEWTRDIAVMFYSPTCMYCKQLAPGWLYIQSLMQSRSLTVGKFNCENSTVSARLCIELGVTRYPSIYYFGYGDFRQSVPGMMVRPPASTHIARFDGDLYLGALYDWVWLLQKISFADRMWDSVRKWLGASPLREPTHRNGGGGESMVRYLGEVERRLQVAETELDRYRMLELFDNIPFHGDIFQLQLHDLQPSQENLPLRTCVSDMASEFCLHDGSDSYCTEQLPACRKNLFESEACRPAVCPLSHRGCRVVSACLRPDVVAEYSGRLLPSASHSTAAT